MEVEQVAIDPHTKQQAPDFCDCVLKARFSPVSRYDAESSIRRVRGQLVNHRGAPVSDVIVAFVDKGPARANNISTENVSVTDEQGGCP